MSEVEQVARQPRKPRRKFNVSAEDFVKAYMEVYHFDGTNEDVAARLNMPPGLVSARRSNYNRQRKDGTKGAGLPSLRRKNSTSVPVATLQNIVKTSKPSS
jgi:hypothetical protein